MPVPCRAPQELDALGGARGLHRLRELPEIVEGDEKHAELKEDVVGHIEGRCEVPEHRGSACEESLIDRGYIQHVVGEEVVVVWVAPVRLAPVP